MVGNVGVKLNLVIGEINLVLPILYSSTFNYCIKNFVEAVTELL